MSHPSVFGEPPANALGAPMPTAVRAPGGAQASKFRAELRGRLEAILLSSSEKIARADRVIVEGQALLGEVRAAVTWTTRSLKAAGTPPEHVLHLLKDELWDELMDAGAAPQVATSIVSSAVRWCIDAYYSAA